MQQKKPAASVQRQIDENLKRVYDDVLNQDLPERFSKLLNELKESQANDTSSRGGPEADE